MQELFDKNMDPEVAEYLKMVRSHPPAYLLSIQDLRRELDKLIDHYPPQPVKKIDNINITGPAGDIPLRIYTPEGSGPFPSVVFYHGGGWCIGSLAGYDSICAALANRIPAVIFSAGYALAPEHPFPAAVGDCYAALEYVAKNSANFNADPGRLIVMGDSAGGNLAVVTSLKAKEKGGPRINLQILIYPAVNLSRLDTESYRLYGNGYDLDKEMIEKFVSHYVPDKKDWADPYVSPAFAKDLKGLPPTLLITAEFDPLRDDGKEFAERLKRAGVAVRHSLYKGVIHGFLSFTTFHAAQKAFDEIKEYIRRNKY